MIFKYFKLNYIQWFLSLVRGKMIGPNLKLLASLAEKYCHCQAR